MGGVWKLKGESSCVDRITVKNVSISTSAGHIMGDVDANIARRAKMRTLKFIVTGQHIEKDPICDFSGLVPGTENYLQAEFVFSDEWAGRKKAATFWKLGREFPAELHGDKIATCKIPRAAVSHIEFGVSVTRMEGKGFVRTNILTVERK